MKTIDRLVARVKRNLDARVSGLDPKMVREMIVDVVDGLGSEAWDGQGQAQDLMDELEGLLYGTQGQ
jgi:hypothetical protein